MLEIKRIAVFCASSSGKDPAYAALATATGRYLAERGIAVVYGGSKRGLMGALADGALEAGGDVTGVLPHFLSPKERAHPGIELVTVESMHERKTKMHELSDAVLALPGGFGTLEELFEMVTWAQLGLHRKPIGLLNFRGYFAPLMSFTERAIELGFIHPKNKDLLLFDEDLALLLEKMNAYEAPPSDLEISVDRS